ncbi:hypothetical protein P9272_29600 [Mesorhizobium sp. WSM4976]|uniref:hypothetical protein n=1 Tax=Mesorhizobium sp. WSM4976 TaxID=3038549 RepID=UPI0024167B73|nr:hypothetical protein [Mesorhizobium sp. WSM4976]MDG4897697.1 hypothetical protein [Mesorhizobium sp. WSM4976]
MAALNLELEISAMEPRRLAQQCAKVSIAIHLTAQLACIYLGCCARLWIITPRSRAPRPILAADAFMHWTQILYASVARFRRADRGGEIMQWLERMTASISARGSLVVPHREARYESAGYRAQMEARPCRLMPDYTFNVTLEHPQRQDEQDIFVEPNGVVLDPAPFLHRVAEALAPFIADKAPG